MQHDDWATAQAIWRAWPEAGDVPAAGTCLRLRDALAGLTGGGALWGDVVALTRQVLLEHQARTGVRDSLLVPRGPGLPGEARWKSARCTVLPTATGLRVSAEPWTPALKDTETAEAEADLVRVHAKGQDRHWDLPADPFWMEALDFDRYSSYGQREAARTLATAPPGGTVIACLPTGQGKTEVAWASVLPATRHGGVAVLVVPTVVLALDMERRLREHLGRTSDQAAANRRYAYTGSLDDDAKETIRQDVRTGTQRVVIAAPEALTTGLSHALEAAATAGHLTHLIIDEAHIVEQWGNDFRPEFRAIAAKRRSWLKAAPEGRQVVTLAMSATLTASQVRTLAESFGGPSPVELVWASQTRAEPVYFVKDFLDRQIRDNAVMDAIGALPRPLILYTTTRQDAAEWAQRIRNAGFGRVTQLTGDSSEKERRAVLSGWRGEDASGEPVATRYDIVVGTSAFGLGVDMPNVRAVVHACLPETIDRYYQEVGRGGRDGQPCVAFMATTPADKNLAERVNRVTLIGDDLGWMRWHTMRLNARPLEEATLEIDLAELPGYLREESARNIEWNVRLLNLMEQAGLIRQEAPARRRKQPETESPSDHQAVLRVVTELKGRLNDPAYFKRKLAAQRQVVHEQQRSALRQLTSLLRGERCVSEVLAEYYRMDWQGGILTTALSCRSCPYCRRFRDAAEPDGMRRRGPNPWPDSAHWPGRPDPLARYRGGSPLLSIYWTRREQLRDLLPDLIEKLARQHCAVVGGAGLSPTLLQQAQQRAAPHPLVVDSDESLLLSHDGPLLWVLDAEATSLPDTVAARLGGPAPTYLVHPAELPDPDRPGTPLRYMNTSISLEILSKDPAW
ncbi:protein DpdF [Actinoplanes sp. DH11]|uniref:protein DpdF n=1 Tax=Actinoplanes sp. DH11 TaxID=2857011 RepID=UPI001E647B33|nr:protein DpdF [Actinoplanes sp. DH11]